MVSFFFHGLHLRLAFLLFASERLVLFKALIHIRLDFSEDVTHQAKLPLERLRFHALKLFRELVKTESFGVHAVAGAYHIGNAKRFELGIITALFVLEIKNRCRHFLCHADKELLLGKPRADKDGLL